MAVRIQNTNVVQFGTLGAAVTVSHVRAQVGNSILTTVALGTAQAFTAGQIPQFDANDIDFVFPANTAGTNGLENAGLNALLTLALDGSNSITIKLMTNATTEVTTAGYTDQDISAWTLSNEAD